MESAPGDRNWASFNERFGAAARLSFGPLSFVLEQTDGEQAAGETLQSTVWTAGCTMVDAMQQGAFDVRALNVLELGSGTGLCGIAAAALGAQSVTITDLPPMLPLLERNAAANSVHCEVKALDWCADEDEIAALLDGWEPSPDLIIGSDITCFVQHLPELARAIERLAVHRDARIVFAHHDRGGDTAFVLSAFGPRFLCQRLEFGTDDNPVRLLELRLRPPSTMEDESTIGGLSAEAVERACRGDIGEMKRMLRQGV